MKLSRTFFWRRLDQPGHDVCRLYRSPEGWQLEGASVFLDAGRAYDLTYQVTADSSWNTRSASIAGNCGRKRVHVHLRPVRPDVWQFGDGEVSMKAGCLDVDLGFTPATNMLAIRRLALRVGQGAEAPAAWVDYKSMRLSTLPQHYQRIDKLRFRYQAPTFGYRGTLRVSSIGAVVSYPGLFKLVK